MRRCTGLGGRRAPACQDACGSGRSAPLETACLLAGRHHRPADGGVAYGTMLIFFIATPCDPSQQRLCASASTPLRRPTASSWHNTHFCCRKRMSVCMHAHAWASIEVKSICMTAAAPASFAHAARVCAGVCALRLVPHPAASAAEKRGKGHQNPPTHTDTHAKDTLPSALIVTRIIMMDWLRHRIHVAPSTKLGIFWLRPRWASFKASRSGRLE